MLSGDPWTNESWGQRLAARVARASASPARPIRRVSSSSWPGGVSPPDGKAAGTGRRRVAGRRGAWFGKGSCISIPPSWLRGV